MCFRPNCPGSLLAGGRLLVSTSDPLTAARQYWKKMLNGETSFTCMRACTTNCQVRQRQTVTIVCLLFAMSISFGAASAVPTHASTVLQLCVILLHGLGRKQPLVARLVSGRFWVKQTLRFRPKEIAAERPMRNLHRDWVFDGGFSPRCHDFLWGTNWGTVGLAGIKKG